MVNPQLVSAKEAIIKVGEGRGFLVEYSPWPHQVITAAHCLPHLPSAHGASYAKERTYANLLGPRDGLPTVLAECVFVDPIADIAVLAAPVGLYEEFEDYDDFMVGDLLYVSTAVNRSARRGS
jgi:hypothetical protein